MPTYDYHCCRCGEFSMIRPIAARNDPAACPSCGTTAGRIEVSSPMLSRVPEAQRVAHVANERAANEPYGSRERRARHGAGCGCCTPRKPAASREGPPALKGFPARRPWQISH